MGATSAPRSVRISSCEVETGTVTTRLAIPTSAQGPWSPFRRVAESIASRGRTLPAHSHQGEEVLTYVLEGVASYQLEDGSAERLPPRSARLLTAESRISHRVSPTEGGTIRWFNLVLQLPHPTNGPPRLQAAPEVPLVDVDETTVRRLVGNGTPIVSAAGLECEVIGFPEESATILRVGEGRRAILYAVLGRGAIGEQRLEVGQCAFVEGIPGVLLEGSAGLVAVLASAPVDAAADPAR